MKRYARIGDGAVAEIFETDGDISTMFHPSILWVDISGETEEPELGWSYDGSAFAAPVSPVLTVEQLLPSFVRAVQQHLDTWAREYGYDDIKSAVTYADEPAVPRFQAEGLAFRAWRSLCWDYCYSLLAEVQAGTTPLPVLEDVLAGLPVLVVDYGQ